MSEKVSTRLDSAVAVTVGGTEYRLEPTLQAYRDLTRFHTGLRECLGRIAALDVDAIATVIIAGTGEKVSVERAEALALALFREVDKTSVANACTDYIVLLLRGGEPVRAGGDEAEGETDPGNP